MKVANSLSKSNNCGQLSQAELNFAEIVSLAPEKEAVLKLQKVREGILNCFQGSGHWRWQSKILGRQPVTLYVSIRNTANVARHANPNYFTLVTRANQSFSYSSKSFATEYAFPAVQLQPGTEASGIVVFDTGEAPRTLIYHDFTGAQVSRDFP